MSRKPFRAALNFLMIPGGAAIYALGFDLFLRPNGINGGGISGVGQLVAYLTPMKAIGVFAAVCNIPLFIVGWKRLGRRFILGSLVGMLASSLFLDLFALLPGFQVEPLLAGVCGGLAVGSGLGLVFLRGASTGGVDIIARLVRQKVRSAPIGRIMLAVDGLIAVLTGLVYRDVNQALYTAVALYASSIAMDAVIYGRNDSGVALIISDRYDEIAQIIDQKLERGATLLQGQGAYTRQEKLVLLCAVKSSQVGRLQALVTEIDPDAFLIVQKAHQVLGRASGGIPTYERVRIACLALLLPLLLSGCSRFVVREYETVTPHAEQYTAEMDEDALTAQNYLSLKNAILSFVENGVEKGVIRTRDYSGDVEEDLSAAAYEVSKLDPLGAYAVDYMTHDCARFVSYYEIHISITFRRSVEDIRAIRRATSNAALPDLINQALAAYEPALTVRLPYYDGQDVEALIRDYYASNPGKAMELPEVTVNVYPESGYVRIVELFFTYSESAEALLQKQESVASNVRAAGEYVHYRRSDEGKLLLLYTYLQERFRYTPGLSATPVYSFLCEGIAGDEGCAKSLQLICEQIGLECRTVAGNRSGAPYCWNIVNVDGVCRHIDLFRALAEENSVLPFYADGELEDYYWDRDTYPECPEVEPADAPDGQEDDGLVEAAGETDGEETGEANEV